MNRFSKSKGIVIELTALLDVIMIMLFWVMMNPPRDKMEKAAFVLDRAMRNPKTLRYRDFYARSPSSDDEESSS